MDLGAQRPLQNIAGFPEWVIVKEGIPTLLESNWDGAPGIFGRKYGLLLTGTGAAASVDVDHFQGGTRSATMTTGNVTLNVSEIKYLTPWYYGAGKYAFEMKFIPDPGFTGNEFDFGIEPRIDDAAGFIQGRAKYNLGTDEWTIETTQDVYESLSAINSNYLDAVIEQPFLSALDGAGDDWGWARLVIDSSINEYVSFQCAAKDAPRFRDYDLRGIPLVNRGSATKTVNLFFTLGITGANSNEIFYTTDWCISKL